MFDVSKSCSPISSLQLPVSVFESVIDIINGEVGNALPFNPQILLLAFPPFDCVCPVGHNAVC